MAFELRNRCRCQSDSINFKSNDKPEIQHVRPFRHIRKCPPRSRSRKVLIPSQSERVLFPRIIKGVTRNLFSPVNRTGPDIRFFSKFGFRFYRAMNSAILLEGCPTDCHARASDNHLCPLDDLAVRCHPMQVFNNNARLNSLHRYKHPDTSKPLPLLRRH